MDRYDDSFSSLLLVILLTVLTSWALGFTLRTMVAVLLGL
jgi:hypothetical protein